MHPLAMALMQALQQQQQPSGVRGTRTAGNAAMARAMAGRMNPKLMEALKPYAESDYADKYGGTANAQQGAFQSDAFQNDAFQVDGVV